LVDGIPVNKGKYVDGSFSSVSVYLVVFLSLLLIKGVWLVVATMDGVVHKFKGMVNLVNNVFLVFIMVVMSQVLIIHEGKCYTSKCHT
jgi:hypothetical protein